LEATVKDSFGNAVPGAVVTFTAPASGAAGHLPGSENGDDRRDRGCHFGGLHGERNRRELCGDWENGDGYNRPGYQLKNQ